MLVEHTRMNPPSGRCSCGHEVPLGELFPAHQAEMLQPLVDARVAAERDAALRSVALLAERAELLARTTLLSPEAALSLVESAADVVRETERTDR